MSLRLTSTKAKLEEMGEETEYACETLSDYRDLILGLTSNTSAPVDIMLNGEYKDVTKAYREIAKVWKELNSMEKAGITKALAGTRQANIFTSLMENFDIVDAAIESAQKASEGIGSAMEEHNRWADSLQARINQINSSLQNLSTDVFKTDDLKKFVSSMNDLVQAIDWVVKKFDAGKIVMGAFLTWVLNTKNILGATLTETGLQLNLFTRSWTLFNTSSQQTRQDIQLLNSSFTEVTTTLQMYNSELGQTSALNTALATSFPKTTLQQYLVSLNGAEASLQGYCVWLAKSAIATEDANIVIQRYISLEAMGADAQALFRNEVAKTNAVMAQYLAETETAALSLKGYERAVKSADIASKALNVTATILKTTLSIGLTFAITALIKVVSDLIEKKKNLVKNSLDAIDACDNEVESLNTLRQSYADLMESTESQSEKDEKLKEIKKQLIEQYGFEEAKIKKINELREDGLTKIDQEIQRQKELALAESEKGFNAAIEQVDNKTSITIGKSNKGLAGNDFFDIKSVRQDILDLFDTVDKYEIKNGHRIFEKDVVGIEAENALEYYNKLKNVIDSIYESKLDKGNLTKDEQIILDQLEYEYDVLTKKYGESYEILEKSAALSADVFYEKWSALEGSYEDVVGTDKFESWFNGLIFYTEQRVDEDQIPYIKSAFKNLFKGISIDAEETVDTITDDGFTAIEALILKAKQGLSKLDGATSDAADSFDDLLKVISDNKEEDKFFSSKEIIELIDKYPKLVDAIEKTQYGYKLNEKALESLKNAKLDEKKTTLQAELDKSRIVLEEAKYRLNIYQQEIDAQQALNDMRAGFNKMVSGDLSGIFDVAKSNESYMKVQSAKKNLEEAQKNVDKIQTQVDLLGTEFDDIDDSTASTKANLSNAKDELSDMKDILNDDKDYIEDLVKLTMDMLKKQKNLEKETLKEKLEGYKEAVKLKKEELDTEKEIYKFQNDLKDKNKSVSDLKQKIDALSVEGVEYSLDDLKRKTELEKEYAEAKQELEEFLYDNEVDTRKDALDKEEDMYEKHIDAQTKAIEDYLDKEGVIRQDAINLINGKTQEFYNDLYNYTLTYTDKSDYEFNKLWNNAYAALEKYGNGQINVLATLAYLDTQLVDTENKIKAIEAASEAASNTTKNGINATREAVEKLNHELEGTAELYAKIYSENGGQIRTVNASDFTSPLSVMNANKTYASDVYKYLNTLPKFHDGGLVDGNGEVLAKLMSGEVVSTQKQAETFLTKTLPNLIDTGAKISNNNNNTTSLSLGNIVINGNATQETVNELKSLQKEIAENIFSKINSQFRKSGIRVAY